MMPRSLSLLLFLGIFSLCLSFVSAEPFELPKEDRFKEGKKALEEFEANAQSSECWKHAIANLKTGCKKMTDLEQSYLAIDFTNCHLQKSGRKTYNCSRDKSVQECTRDMDDLAFTTYTQFFTHTTNICFYLQSHAWQERTENTIAKLSSTTEQVVDQIENSLNNQILMIKHQHTSLDNQKQIIDRERQLSTTLKDSTLEAREAFDDMKAQATQQKAIFTETFEGIFKSVENIKQLQSMLLGEFITLQSLAFHFVAVCVCYFFTSSPRTAGARLPLFFGLIILMGMERLVTAWGIKDGSDSQSTEVVHFRLWLCRKLFILASTLALMVTAYRYQDYNKINFNLLQQIQHQIEGLKILQAQEKSMKAITNGDTLQTTTCSFSQPWNSQLTSQSALSVTCTSDKVDSGVETSEEVDVTYVPVNNTETDSLSDYESVYSESSFDLSSFMQTPLHSSSQGDLNHTDSQLTTPRKSRSRATLHASLSPSHHYNLRPRTPQATSITSSFIESQPSPATLAELVENLNQTTACYRAKLSRSKSKQ